VGWHICAPGDAQAKGPVERLIGFLETSFEQGREFLGPLDFQERVDRWFDGRANRRLHRTLRRLAAQGTSSECRSPAAQRRGDGTGRDQPSAAQVPRSRASTSSRPRMQWISSCIAAAPFVEDQHCQGGAREHPSVDAPHSPSSRTRSAANPFE